MANVTTIYACATDGLAIFNKPGTLNEWLPPRRVLVGLPVPSVWAEPGPPIRVVAVQGGVLMVSENAGRAWEKAGIEGPALALVAGNRQREIYAALEGGGLLSSDDGGSTWMGLPPLPGDATQLINGGQVFYLIAGGSLYSGTPESGTWRLLIQSAITAAGYDDGTGSLYAASRQGITKSDDAGVTWTQLTGAPSDAAALQVVPGAAGKPPALVVGTPGGITVSQDGGEKWHSTGIAPNVTTFARDPERRDRLYAGTSEGYIFESGNRGQAWTQVNALPLLPVTFLFVVRL